MVSNLHQIVGGLEFRQSRYVSGKDVFQVFFQFLFDILYMNVLNQFHVDENRSTIIPHFFQIITIYINTFMIILQILVYFFITQ